MKKLLCVAAMALGLAQCVPMPLPRAAVDETRALVSRAEQLGAAMDPRAGPYLRNARDEAARAQGLAEGGDPRARSLLAAAAADAQLAVALVHQSRAADQVKRARAQVRAAEEAGGVP